MTSREKFEAWYLENWGHTEDDHETLFERDPDSDEDYYRLGVRLAHEAWQAAELASEQKLTDMAVQLANAESKCRELAAENAYLLNGASRELNTSWMFHKTMLGAQAALVCLTHGYQAAAREWLEGTTDEAGAEIPDDISVGELHEWFESNMVSNGGNSGFLTRKEAEVAIRKECPATDAFLAEVRAQGVDYAIGVIEDCANNLSPGGTGEAVQYAQEMVNPYLDSIHDKLADKSAQLRKGGAA